MKMTLNAHFLHDEQLGNLCFAIPIDNDTVGQSIVAYYDDNFLYILKDWDELTAFDKSETEIRRRIFHHTRGDGIKIKEIVIDSENYLFLRTLSCVQLDRNSGMQEYHKQLMKHENGKFPYK